MDRVRQREIGGDRGTEGGIEGETEGETDNYKICPLPSFHISYYPITIILVSASSSCFALPVPMREVSCVRYTLCAWDPRSP